MRPARVLFLCTGNSARSVMAEALLRRLGGPGFEAHSAGTRPKGLNPYTRRVLAEVGIGLDGFRSRPVSEFEGQQFDYVITVCDAAAEECPVFPGRTTRLHWSIPDPAMAGGGDSQKLAAFQETLTSLRQRVEVLIREVSFGVRPASAEQGGSK